MSGADIVAQSWMSRWMYGNEKERNTNTLIDVKHTNHVWNVKKSFGMKRWKTEMKMRDYELLKDIQIPDEQEKMMDIICDAWHECQNSDCKNCIDRPEKFMTLFFCFCLKCSRRLIEAGYKKQDTQEVKHSKWIYKYPKEDIERAYDACQRYGISNLLP